MNDEYKEALDRIEKAKKEKSTLLDLEGLSLTALPDQLFELSQLTSLDLRRRRCQVIYSFLTKKSL